MLYTDYYNECTEHLYDVGAYFLLHRKENEITCLDSQTQRAESTASLQRQPAQATESSFQGVEGGMNIE